MSLVSNIQEKANLICAVAGKLAGPYKPHEYGGENRDLHRKHSNTWYMGKEHC